MIQNDVTMYIEVNKVNIKKGLDNMEKRLAEQIVKEDKEFRLIEDYSGREDYLGRCEITFGVLVPNTVEYKEKMKRYNNFKSDSFGKVLVIY